MSSESFRKMMNVISVRCY